MAKAPVCFCCAPWPRRWLVCGCSSSDEVDIPKLALGISCYFARASRARHISDTDSTVETSLCAFYLSGVYRGTGSAGRSSWSTNQAPPVDPPDAPLLRCCVCSGCSVAKIGECFTHHQRHSLYHFVDSASAPARFPDISLAASLL